MTRSSAQKSAEFLLKEIAPMLSKIWNGRAALEFNYVFLKHVRDKIHATCLHFEKSDGAEEHEDLYLPLFDALSLLTDCLLKRPIDRELLGACMERLDDLSDLLLPAPV